MGQCVCTVCTVYVHIKPHYRHNNYSYKVYWNSKAHIIHHMNFKYLQKKYKTLIIILLLYCFLLCSLDEHSYRRRHSHTPPKTRPKTKAIVRIFCYVFFFSSNFFLFFCWKLGLNPFVFAVAIWCLCHYYSQSAHKPWDYIVYMRANYNLIIFYYC